MQVILTKNSTTPTSVDCNLQNVPQSVVVSNVDGGVPVGTLTGTNSATDPNITGSESTNSTVALAPGEVAFVTLRANVPPDVMATLVQGLTPVVTAHGTNTNGTTPDFAVLLFVQIPQQGTTLLFRIPRAKGRSTAGTRRTDRIPPAPQPPDAVAVHRGTEPDVGAEPAGTESVVSQVPSAAHRERR